MIEIKKYETSMSKQWDDFVMKSRIDSFILNRNFMDYHSDRFEDFSLMIFRKGKLDALLPGNINNSIFYSHQGLTYGGIVLSKSSSLVDILSYFEQINIFLKDSGIKEVVYKPTPHIYHKLPSQEDIYALYKLNSKKIGCNISSTIFANNRLPFIESRKSGLRKARNNSIELVESATCDAFWDVLSENLIQTHGVKPVHSIEEIKLLQSRFPNNIINFNCLHETKVVAGCVLFIMKNVVHVQYISASLDGKMIGALDLLFDYLINEKYHDIPFFDFGQSTEKMGETLNENLIFQKEGFGARGVTYDIYQYTL